MMTRGRGVRVRAPIRSVTSTLARQHCNSSRSTSAQSSLVRGRICNYKVVLRQQQRRTFSIVAAAAVATKFDPLLRLSPAEIGMPVGWDAGVMAEEDDDGG